MNFNRKGFELAISTLIIIIIGISVLIGIIYAVTNGFKDLKSSTDPFLDTTQLSSLKQVCSLACQSTDKITFCCSKFSAKNEKIQCSDERLEINCNIDCENFLCGNQTN